MRAEGADKVSESLGLVMELRAE
eukprot:SAG31_NODE_30921_length_374_cov_1.290909_1_plen_22_part_10